MIYPLPLIDFPKWQRVLQAQPPVLITPVQGELLDTLEQVCRSTDFITYKTDEKDYWQTPAETEERKTGDCEDYAIYRLYGLWRRGFPGAELVVGERDDGQIHAVCMAEDYVLCNTMPHPVKLDLYDLDFSPLYALTTTGGRRWKDG